jgi:hypothetical protein
MLCERDQKFVQQILHSWKDDHGAQYGGAIYTYGHSTRQFWLHGILNIEEARVDFHHCPNGIFLGKLGK